MNQGELNGRAKLTEQNVKTIKLLLKLGYTQRVIGKKFGVYSSTISMINTGKLWKHVEILDEYEPDTIEEAKASLFG